MNGNEQHYSYDLHAPDYNIFRWYRAGWGGTPKETRKASVVEGEGDHAEDAWFELDHLVAKEPSVGWEVLTGLAARCSGEDECAQIAAGPLTTFLRTHRDEFSSKIEEELMRNAGFRMAYHWLQ